MVKEVILPRLISTAHAQAKVPASAPAPAASSPASVASAPQAQASQPTAAVAPAKTASAPSPQASSPTAAVAPVEAADDERAEPKKFRFNAGETASGRFGSKAQQFCDHNKIANCNIVRANVDYDLPEGVEPKEVKVKRAASKDASPKAPRVVRRAPMMNDAGEILYRSVGTAPLNGCGKRDILAIAEEAWAVLGISEEDRAWLRQNIDAKGGPRFSNAPQGFVKLVPDMRLEQVTFCREGKVVSVGPMRTAWHKDDAVYGEKFVLPSGKTLVWMRNCFNWVPWIPEERPAPQPTKPKEPRKDPPTEEPKPTPPSRDEQPRVVIPPVDEDEVVVQKYDWDAGVYVGLDRDVKYAGGEGAFYPGLYHRNWGRYAVGIGGLINFWDGSTPADWDFSGRYGAVGLAQKWSRYDGRDFGFKFPMVGTFHERGGRAAFHETRDAKLLCASMAYTDASREKAGAKVLPEWQVWMSFCDPTSQSKSRTVFGQTANTDGMQDINYILSAGGRVYLTKDLTGLMGEGGVAAQLQPFVELGVNKTAPNPFSAHAYGGVRGVKKISSLGVGPHYSSAGTVLGATYNHDVGRHVKLHNAEERWAAMVKSLEALGVAVD